MPGAGSRALRLPPFTRCQIAAESWVSCTWGCGDETTQHCKSAVTSQPALAISGRARGPRELACTASRPGLWSLTQCPSEADICFTCSCVSVSCWVVGLTVVFPLIHLLVSRISNGNFFGDKVFTDDPIKVRPLGWVQHACVLLKRGRLDTGSHMRTHTTQKAK